MELTRQVICFIIILPAAPWIYRMYYGPSPDSIAALIEVTWPNFYRTVFVSLLLTVPELLIGQSLPSLFGSIIVAVSLLINPFQEAPEFAPWFLQRSRLFLLIFHLYTTAFIWIHALSYSSQTT